MGNTYNQQQGHPVLPPPSTLGSAGSTGNPPFYQLPSISGLSSGGPPPNTNGQPQAQAQAQPQQQNSSQQQHTSPPLANATPAAAASGYPLPSLPPNNNASASLQQSVSQQQAQAQAASNAQQVASAAYRPLNVKDALSYLDQVKVQFHSQPDVYNHFLDIMKDFKSQSIDTPGVIDRVSNLFRGHPNLIQGFNTFLPPGYRIECSLDPMDPNPIRVTTPMGTTSRNDGGMAAAAAVGSASNAQAQAQDQANAAGAYGSEQWPTSGASAVAAHQAPEYSQQTPSTGSYPAYPQAEAATGNTTIEDGSSMSQLHAAANGNRPPPVTEQRRQGGPVEFNHAINYVNKIKNRFSSQPEIYKSFLEILQTYQREQLRIAEVYSQVSVLFKDAPDLLDDFKQFLPDTQSGRPEVSGGSDPMRLPPLGNFAPPGPGSGSGSVSSQGGQGPGGVQLPPTNGRKKRNSMSISDQQQPQTQSQHHPGSAQYAMENNMQMSNLRGGAGPLGNGAIPTGGSVSGSRRSRGGESSPSLIPSVPEALPPPSRISNNYEEITFFDKVKKFLGNKQTYHEFLKLMNLFSQQVIDKNTLVERTELFIGENHELMDWFKRFVKYEGKPFTMENTPFKKHLLDMNICRFYGPSYRLIPKRDRWMPCSGRDEMCWDVLNDEWIVHPTWASEDSGVVSHRKNQYEEILYRIEDERHEYDYYMESNLRAIQTLETIANRIANMTLEEKAAFKLPVGLGHTSTIYQKVIRKIYDKEKGKEVIDALHENPAVAVPIVLRRMKQKDEEWRRAHQEWNKVWRETVQKVFFKSLDHIGLTFKQTDKKMMTVRSLVSEITVIKAEQNSHRKAPTAPPPKEQLSFKIDDVSVLSDTVRLLTVFLEHGGGSYSSNDRERMLSFYKSFICQFFSIPDGELEKGLPGQAKAQEVDDSATAVTDPTNNENSATPTVTVNGKKRPRESSSSGDLLKEVLKKARSLKDADESEDSNDGENGVVPGSVEESAQLFEGESEARWLKHVDQPSKATSEFEKKMSVSDPSKPRETFNLFANTTIYALLRYIQILYCRLAEVKSYEDLVRSELSRSRSVDFANDLDLYDRKLEEKGLWFSPDKCYEKVLDLCEQTITGQLEHQLFEEALRQAYRSRSYKLYTVEKVLQAIAKHVHLTISDQKSADTLVLYQSHRAKPTNTLKEQILYRIQVRSVIGNDENMFRIDWDNGTKDLKFQFLGIYALTMKDVKSAEDRWNYYLTSYMMSLPTEGVPLDKIKTPLLTRSMVEPKESSEGGQGEVPDESFIIVDQALTARVCMNTYKLFFEAGTNDYFARASPVSTRTDKVLAQRKARFESFLSGSYGWRSELEDNEAEKIDAAFETLKSAGPKAFLDAIKVPDDDEEQEKEMQVDTEAESAKEASGNVDKEDKEATEAIKPTVADETATNSEIDAQQPSEDAEKAPKTETEDAPAVPVSAPAASEDVEMTENVDIAAPAAAAEPTADLKKEPAAPESSAAVESQSTSEATVPSVAPVEAEPQAEPQAQAEAQPEQPSSTAAAPEPSAVEPKVENDVEMKKTD